MSHQIKNCSLSGRIFEETGVNVSHCYQCGKCSAGCSIATDMDITSSTSMRLLQCEEEDTDKELLQSGAIWLCLSCEMCVSRCPMQVDIPKVMDFLRQESLRRKYRNKSAQNIIRFHRSFMDMVRQTGRSYEVGLVVDYKLRSKKWMQDILLVPKMLVKGKLPLFPEFVKNRQAVKRLFKKAKV